MTSMSMCSGGNVVFLPKIFTRSALYHDSLEYYANILILNNERLNYMTIPKLLA